MAVLRATVVLAAFLLFTLPLMPVQALLIGAGPASWCRRFPHWYHRQVCRLLGVRIHLSGSIEAGSALLVANHVSWLDIPVLSAVAPVSFIAKREVAGWPFVGWLAKLQRSVFVDRNRRSAAGHQSRDVAARLADGDVLVLFAEGTTGDGNRVFPFKSTLLAAAASGEEDGGSRPTLQRLTIAYTRLAGLPLGRHHRPLVAWYGDMGVPDHGWALLKSGPVDVVVQVGAPVPLGADFDRKALSRTLEGEVAADFSRVLRAGSPPARR